ncbi:phage tail assembly protein [Ancylobacter defluvii]|uniref:Tail assembly chaperone E/41/14-like protein n=1 Tax=Ancylobacter defluvii TaxID=1282440 RepID=A0A9W6K0Y4_9HYPH|nr:phage tail assembly protein [Ancylobacter defluvii]MBS7586404.1 phage tail assembly protein [Ancylobacter defluvii]GLK85685.1 hypothetical protein GCM10017653_37550 [Ancylobacter defluvii]
MSTHNSTAPIVISDDEERSPAPASAVVVDDHPVVVVDEDAGLGGELPTRAQRNPNGSVSLPLRRPVAILRKSSHHGDRQETIDVLTFRELNGADLRAVAATAEAHKPIVMLARSAGINEAVMGKVYDNMSAADIADASTVVASFFGDGPKGKTRS